MKKAYPFLLFFLGAVAFSAAQGPAGGCAGSTEGVFLHGNNVRAYINNSGTLFYDGEKANFEVPFSNLSEKNTIFGQALWLGARGPDGDLRIAAPTYRLRLGEYEYYPGPAEARRSPGCRKWDRVWVTYRHEIETHIEDFTDNGVVDSPISDILGWPGAGNPHFAEIHGFHLPVSPQGLAPFADVDGDGVYDPLSGDYPMISQSEVIPEQLCWTLFNDTAGPHRESGGKALGVEVHLTAWALDCEDNRQLNNTIFLSYKIINRGEVPLDSMYAAPWLDYELGCFFDNAIGSAPALNTVFAYNQDNTDGATVYPSCAPEFSFGLNPPVQAATILNQPLSSVMYYDLLTGGWDPVLMMSQPDLPEQYYYYLTARWRDGRPLTYGSDGYMGWPNSPTTNFVYPGDPNAPASWAAVNGSYLWFPQLLIPSISVGQLLPGEAFSFDMAHSNFREEGYDHLENVTAMYAGIESLQEWYDSRFAAVCTPPTCQQDCVWPGDANADGIADHYDLLPIGRALGVSGPARNRPPNWAPQQGERWTPPLQNGVSYQHADADGNGLITLEDFMITVTHYQRTRPGHLPSRDRYQEGPEIHFRYADDMPVTLGTGRSRAGNIDIVGIPGLYGIALSMEYDTNYFEIFRPFFDTGFDKNIPEYRRYDATKGQVDYARLAASPGSTIGEGRLFTYYLRTKSEFPDTLTTNITKIRFKNIRAIRHDGTEIPVGGVTTSFIIPEIPVLEVANENEGAGEVFQLFPNPADGRLELRFPGRQAEGIEVLDVAGKRVWQGEGLFVDSAGLDLRGLPGGVYFVRMQFGEVAAVRRVVLR